MAKSSFFKDHRKQLIRTTCNLMADSDIDRCNILKIPDLFLFRNNFPGNSDPMPSFNRQKPLAQFIFIGIQGIIGYIFHRFTQFFFCHPMGKKFFLSLFFHCKRLLFPKPYLLDLLKIQSMIQQDPSDFLRKHRQNLIFLFSSHLVHLSLKNVYGRQEKNRTKKGLYRHW